MIRVTVPREVAEALMSGGLRLLVVGAHEHIYTSWNPTPIRKPGPPMQVVRAIEAGERIGIDVECQTSVHLRPGRECIDNSDCTDGRVRVGSVRPTKVMPITDDDNDDCPGVPHLFVQSEAPFDDGHQVFGCGYSPCDVSESLAAYGPAESLVGKFAVEVEDARREP